MLALKNNNSEKKCKKIVNSAELDLEKVSLRLYAYVSDKATLYLNVRYVSLSFKSYIITL